ncbi:MAG: SIS domain-containing protein [Chloroflexi bacterium]|nr:MAG: SIS domain-containing protein [Chloroflexota bacterium]
MNQTPSTDRNPYLQNILEQPQALADTLAGLRANPSLDPLPDWIASGSLRRVVLTGMGSSCRGFYPLHYALLQAGLASILMETSELIYYAGGLLRSDTLLIAASQSGESAEIVRLLEINQGRAAVLGITNTPGSTLAKLAGQVLLIRAGVEATVSSKTYVAIELVLPWLADRLLGRPVEETLAELSQASWLCEKYLKDWERHADWFAGALVDASSLFYVGRGPSLAAAETGGLITKESTHFAAEGMSSAAFRHGPVEIVRPGTVVVIFAGEPATRALNLRLAEDIERMGGRALVVSESSPVDALRLPAAPPSLRPVLEILPIQMMTLALAKLAGHTAGAFSHATKVTTEE